MFRILAKTALFGGIVAGLSVFGLVASRVIGFVIKWQEFVNDPEKWMEARPKQVERTMRKIHGQKFLHKGKKASEEEFQSWLRFYRDVALQDRGLTEEELFAFIPAQEHFRYFGLKPWLNRKQAENEYVALRLLTQIQSQKAKQLVR